MLTKVGVKQLTDFLRTVTAASDLVDCTLVNCDIKCKVLYHYDNIVGCLRILVAGRSDFRVVCKANGACR